MPVFTSSIEVTADYPTIKPSLNLNFARSRALDPRITFTRSSVGTYVGRDGLIKTAGVNEPRFDHDPETLESLGLLIEDTRTNLWNYSSDLTITDSPVYGNWNAASRTSNVAVSPDGLTEGDRATFSTATASIVKRFSATAGTVYTFTIYLKKDPTSIDTLLNQFGFIISWSNDGSTLTSYTFPDLVSGQNASDVLTDEWKRFTLSYECPAGATSMEFGISNRGAGTATLSQAYSVLCWGAQIETGSFPTSYIPTSGSTVTRDRDDATIVGESFNSFYNQNEGSLFVESTPIYVASGINHRVCVITGDSDFTTSGAPGGINVDYEGTTLRTELFGGSPNSAQQGTGLTVSSGNKNKLAYGLETNNVSVIVNGTQVGSTDTSASMPDPMTKMGIGRRPDTSSTYADGIHVSSIQYYPKRLTNAQLQLLTS